jgi:hypothetical protein
MPKPAYTLIAVVLCGLWAGCGEDPDAAMDVQVRVDTVGDTIMVRTVSGSVWGDAARLEAEVSIGALDGPDEYILGSPEGLAVAEDGTIYVLDTQVPVLRAFGADGRHLRDLGRSGAGPGEYESPDADPWNWRFALVRYSPSGEILDTVRAPTWDYDPARVTASGEGSRSVRTVPFTARTAWTFSPLGYFVGGLSTGYGIDLFRPDQSVMRLERQYSPVAVTAAEADEQRRRITQGLQRQYGGWRWNGPAVPDAKPPFKDVFVSWEGDVWVVVSTEALPVMTEAEAREEEEASGRVALRFAEPVAFDVFALDGRYLGHVRAPVSFRIDPEPVIRGDYVWAITRDELDVASVTRFRIVHGESVGERAR